MVGSVDESDLVGRRPLVFVGAWIAYTLMACRHNQQHFIQQFPLILKELLHSPRIALPFGLFMQLMVQPPGLKREHLAVTLLVALEIALPFRLPQAIDTLGPKPQMRIIITAKRLIPNHQLLKHHLITRQRSRLIRQDILNLAKLLIYTHAVAFQGFVVTHTAHIGVFLHEVALEDFDELQADDERNRDHCVVEDEVTAEGD